MKKLNENEIVDFSTQEESGVTIVSSEKVIQDVFHLCPTGLAEDVGDMGTRENLYLGGSGDSCGDGDGF